MARPKFVQAKRTTLKIGISSTEASSIVLTGLVDIYDNAVDINTFGGTLYLTINPGGDTEEIISATGFTVNSDKSVTVDTGIIRGLKGISDYTAGGTPSDHAPGTVVVVSNNPQMYEAILSYIDAIAIAGSADASTIGAGISEEATQSEIDADTGVGATLRRLFVNPAQLALSKYGLQLPSTAQKTFLNAVTGVMVDYAGDTAPTGFLLCDGTAYNNNDYADLIKVIKGSFGTDSATVFTADSTTDVYTATSHGLTDGDIVLVDSNTTLPTGLSIRTVYYVITATTNTFQLSTTSGGTAVDITDTGTGTHSFYTQFNTPDFRSSIAVYSGAKVNTFNFVDSDVDTATEIITIDSNDFLHTGQSVVLSTTGTLPAGLSAGTYYVIRVSDTTIKLATTIPNANEGTAVDITGATGGGTHTLTQTLTTRTVGEKGGEETHALTDSEMPSHTHVQYISIGNSGSLPIGNGQTSSPNTSQSTGNAGSDTVHNNMPPYVVVTKIIKT